MPGLADGLTSFSLTDHAMVGLFAFGLFSVLSTSKVLSTQSVAMTGPPFSSTCRQWHANYLDVRTAPASGILSPSKDAPDAQDFLRLN
jgi:hypothetical protein